MPAVDEWLLTASDTIAAAAGIPAEELRLSAEEQRALLDVARVAAHTSGERTNAPLVCYLLGLAAARSGVELDTLAEGVTRG